MLATLSIFASIFDGVVDVGKLAMSVAVHAQMPFTRLVIRIPFAAW